MSCAHSTRSSGWNSTGNKLLTGAINKLKRNAALTGAASLPKGPRDFSKPDRHH